MFLNCIRQLTLEKLVPPPTSFPYSIEDNIWIKLNNRGFDLVGFLRTKEERETISTNACHPTTQLRATMLPSTYTGVSPTTHNIMLQGATTIDDGILMRENLLPEYIKDDSFSSSSPWQWVRFRSHRMFMCHYCIGTVTHTRWEREGRERGSENSVHSKNIMDYAKCIYMIFLNSSFSWRGHRY